MFITTRPCINKSWKPRKTLETEIKISLLIVYYIVLGVMGLSLVTFSSVMEVANLTDLFI